MPHRILKLALRLMLCGLVVAYGITEGQRVMVDIHPPQPRSADSDGGDALNDALLHYTSLASRQRGVDVLVRFQASGEWVVTGQVRALTGGWCVVAWDCDVETVWGCVV
jgi:hypothetical protein